MRSKPLKLSAGDRFKRNICLTDIGLTKKRRDRGSTLIGRPMVNQIYGIADGARERLVTVVLLTDKVFPIDV